MAIFKKGKTWYIDYYVNGRRNREAVGSSKKPAESILAKRRVQVVENRFLDIESRPNVKFEQLATQYLEYAKTNKRSWERDARSIRVLDGWFHGKKLFEITALQIENYKSARVRVVSPPTVNRELACFKHMFTKAIEWEMATKNPVKQVKLFQENPGRIRYLENEEVTRLLEECTEHLRPIIIVALFTGMRKSEILALQWSDLDLKRKIIHIEKTKSGHSRDIPMADPVFFALKGRQTQSEHVFSHEDGTPRINIRTAFDNNLRRAQIKDFTFHDLRHTFASHLIMNGVDLLTVKELLGHRSINMTLRYAHLSPEHKKKAVASLKYFDGHNMDTKKDTKEAKST